MGGKCVAAQCSPGTTACADLTTLATCNAGGTGYTNSACGAAQVCDGGTCQPQVCTPGAVSCSGTQVVQCEALGLATAVVTDCAVSGQLCSAGACQAVQLCTPGASSCVGSKQQTCQADGNSWKESTCDDSNPCTSDGCDAKTAACAFDAIPADGKACPGGLCAGGACGLPCKTGVDCPVSCACGGSGVCTGSPSPAASFTVDTAWSYGGWHAFRKEWWFADPASTSICRFAPSGAALGCFDGGVKGITQIWGESTADYAYVSVNKEVRKWKGLASQMLWTYQLQSNSSAGLKGVAADNDYVYIAPTWGPTNLERVHKVSGAWLTLLAQGMPVSVASGLVVHNGVAYMGSGLGGVAVVDITLGKPVAQVKGKVPSLLLRGSMLCTPTGVLGPGNLTCWNLDAACAMP